MNKKLQEIFRENMEFEKESPYNFCDRWCERCVYETQIRCRVYLDEFERKIVCIAHGKEPDDPEITKAVMKRQFEDMGEEIGRCLEENEIDIDAIDDPVFEKTRESICRAENHPLQCRADQYLDLAHRFLKETFYKSGFQAPALVRDFETISWYHMLMPVKLKRALSGYHESAHEEGIALYDAVAQFQICKKAITQSVEALHGISKGYASYQAQIQTMLALLCDIHGGIEKLEEDIG